jgi:hypothetical protein
MPFTNILVACLVSVVTALDVQPPDPRDFAISLDLTAEADLLGPPVLRQLATERYRIEAAEMGRRWAMFMDHRGTEMFLIDQSLRLVEAQQGTSNRREVQLDAFQAHLQRMLLACLYEKQSFEAGRIACADFNNPFRWAAADAKFRLAKAIFAQREKETPSREELEAWWAKLASPDSATACRAGWEMEAAGAAGEDFLRRHIRQLDRPGGAEECGIETWITIGEVMVQGAFRGEDLAPARQRVRALGLLKEMHQSPRP